MNQILHELKLNRKSILLWSLFMIFITYASLVKFSAFSESGVSIVKLLDSVPKFVRILLGLENIDLTSMKGFYTMMFLYFSLIAAIHASSVGAVTVLKEERDATADFLLTKPLTRMKVIGNMILASFIQIVIINLVAMLSSFYSVSLFNTGDSINGTILSMMGCMFIEQSLFLTIGLCIASWSKNNERSASISGYFMLATFILSMIIELNDRLDFLKYFTPFKYFDAKEIIYGPGIDPILLLLSFFLIGITLAGTFYGYKKRDILN